MTPGEIERIVTYQVETLGPRDCGARGARELFAFLKKEMRAHGYDTDEQTFAMRAMRIRRLEHRIGEAPFYALPYFGCPPFYPYTQDIRLEAPLKVSSRLPARGAEGRGSVLLTDIADGPPDRQILAHKAAGYRGVIFISPRETDDDLLGLFSAPGSPHLADVSAWTDFPVVCVSRETGELLKREASRGRLLRQDVGVSVEAVTARNLCIRRARSAFEVLRPARVRVVCHYDSAFEAPDLPGASDNASGVAVLTAVLKDLQRQGACPPDVEFVYYDAEEYLLFGALSLSVDLDGELARRAWNGLYDVLASRDGARMDPTGEPEHIIEIDTVGCGRTLRYGTNKPREVADFLRTRNLGGMFDNIQLSREKGNVEHAAAQAGIIGGATYHFLTLGAGRRAHTRRDDLAHIDGDDMDAFAVFLKALILSI